MEFTGTEMQWRLTLEFDQTGFTTPTGYRVEGFNSAQEVNVCPMLNDGGSIRSSISNLENYGNVLVTMPVISQGSCRTVRFELRAISTNRLVDSIQVHAGRL